MRHLPLAGAVIALVLAIPLATLLAPASTSTAASYPPTTTAHYEYVFPDGHMYVYDIDNGFSLVYSTALPTSAGMRGAVASPTTGMLYVSYGGDGGSYGSGSLLKYDLVHNTLVWQKSYSFGIDSMAITPDGKTIYMPDGEFSGNGTWYVLDAGTGSVLGSIAAGTGPHNTVVSLNGSHAYLGGRFYNYLEVASTSSNAVVQKIGPLKGGVRPFTITGTESYAFMDIDGFEGFQVGNIATGQVVYTVPFTGFSGPYGHGISLTPDQSQLYALDQANSYVHVYSLTQGFPASAPAKVKDIKLNSMSGSESPCGYDCSREGWLQHSRDGRYVFVGDSGDIISTATMTPLPRDTSSSSTIFSTLYNTRKFLEIDWANGAPSSTTSRYGLGYVTTTGATPTLTATGSTSTPTPTPKPSATATPKAAAAATPTSIAGNTVIAQDTFQRANQGGWGTASDGLVWGGDATNGTYFKISSNTGVVSSSTSSCSAVLGPTAANAQVLFSGSLSSYSSANLGAVLRWTDSNNWYKAYIDGTRLVLQKRVGGTFTTLATTSFTATAGTSYSLRFQVSGTTLSARVWAASTAEPSTWMVTATDSSLSSGYSGLRMLSQSGTATYSSFTAYKLP